MTEKVKSPEKKFPLDNNLQMQLIILFLLIGLIPFITASVLSYNQSPSAIHNEVENKLFGIGIQKADSLHKWINQRKVDLHFLTETPTMQINSEILTSDFSNSTEKNNSRTFIEDIFNDLLIDSGVYEEFLYFAPNGTILAQSQSMMWNNSHPVGSNIVGKDYYMYIIANQINASYIFVSDIRKATKMDITQMVVSTPVYNIEHKNITGGLVAFVMEQLITTFVHETEGLGVSGQSYLVNVKLQFITAPEFVDIYVGAGTKYNSVGQIILKENITTEGANLALKTKTNVIMQNVDYKGDIVLGSYIYLEAMSDAGTPWILCIEILTSEIFAPITSLYITMWIIIAIAGVLIVTVSYQLGSKMIQKIQKNQGEIRELKGLLPICANCKNIRNDAGYWQRIEEYLHLHINADFTHGLCPNCAKELYPEFYKEPE